MNRGYWREPIFHDDIDRKRFVTTLSEACAKTDWQVHAYCLMNNHFHLVFETPEANLVAGMRWFLSTYTARFNRRHKQFGHLFSGRYKSLIVDGSGTGYLRTVCDYVHLNPVRAKLLRRNKSCAILHGAVGRIISSRRSNVRAGCGWTGCWANCTFPRTALPGGRNWRIIWK